MVGPFRVCAALAPLLARVVAPAPIALLHLDVAAVGDIAAIPDALPPLVAPDLSAIPDLLVGSFAVALVALAQAAGISAAVPNPDGSRPSTSGDFVGQGIANVAGGIFGALPTGGSLSRTGVAVSAGARTRWAGIFAGLWLIGLVAVAGSLAEIIPMPVIGGLILVIGIELVVGRWADIALVFRTAPWSALALVVTFLATTQLPLQNAILIGAVLSLLLYCVQAARTARLVALDRTDTGRWRIIPVPDVCASEQVTVLHYTGVGLFAEVPRIDESWPRVDQTRDAVVVLSMRTMPDVPSATVIEALRKHTKVLEGNGSRLMIAGVDARFARILERSGLTAELGGDAVVQSTDELFEALDIAMARARQWLAR